MAKNPFKVESARGRIDSLGERHKVGVAMMDASPVNHSENAKTANACTGEVLEGPRVGPPRNCEVAKTLKEAY